MRNIKFVLIAIFCAIMGFFACYLLIYIPHLENAQKATSIYAADEIAEEEKTAIEAFTKFPPTISLYAQQRLIANAARQNKVGLLNDKNYSRLIGLAQGRMALSYHALSRESEAKQSMDSAIHYLDKAQMHMTPEKLVELLKRPIPN